MLKRTATVLFFVTVFAIGGLGFGTDAMATGDYSDEMSEDYSCNNFNIRLKKVLRVPGPEDVFRYRYRVTGADLPIYKMALLEFGIGEALDATETDHIKVFPPGEGGFGRDNWLEGVPQLQVLSRHFKKNKEESIRLVIEVAGTGGNIGTVAAHTKANNNESESGIKSETCFIEGPVPGLPADATVPATKQVVFNDEVEGEMVNVEYCVDLDPRTGCPYPERLPYECANPENVLEPDADFVIGSNSENDSDGPSKPTWIGDGNCPVIKAAHNPCQWVLLSGRAYGPYCW